MGVFENGLIDKGKMPRNAVLPDAHAPGLEIHRSVVGSNLYKAVNSVRPRPF
jgi:hypothetical protein